MQDSPALARLKEVIGDLDRLVVAFSGGADSSLVARVATDVLGADRVLCATAVSDSLAGEELADCEALAAEWGLRWQAVRTSETSDAAYVANDTMRCYHCKSHLMDALAPIAHRERAVVALGVNLDDLTDERPGQVAAYERGARFPLVDAGLTKSEVRAVSSEMGLRTWDKPAAPCLASRIPYGTPVSITALGAVGRAEAALHRLGFREVRVRHYGTTARLELPLEDLPRALGVREAIVGAVRDAGYQYVTLDLEGLRSGNLNRGASCAPASDGTLSHVGAQLGSPSVMHLSGAPEEATR
jgi:uncharacterized protein